MKYILILILLITSVTLSGQSNKVNIDDGRVGNYKGNVVDLCITPKGTILIVPEANRICFYDINSRVLLKQWETGHSKSILALDISGDGTLLSSGGTDSTVIVRNILSGEIEKKFNDQRGVITSLSFNSDHSMLASGSSDKTVYVYDLTKGIIKYKLDDFPGSITAVRFSPDDQFLAVASLDQKIILYDSQNGQLIATLDGHKNSVRDLSFDKEGTRLFSCGDDSRMIIWDIKKTEPDQD